MEARMRSVFGWMRRRLERLGATPSRARKRPGRVVSALESLERREVLSSATLLPFAAMPGQVTPIVTAASTIAPSTTVTTTTTSAVPATVYQAPSVAAMSLPAAVISPASIGTAAPTATPAYYYGQSVVQAPASVQASTVAPVYYAGQPVVAASAVGATPTNLETDYVQALYRTVLDRVGTPTEVDAWVAEMDQGMTVPQVALSFVNSLEHRQDEVDSYYEEFLHRTPDVLANLWVNDLLSGASEEAVAEAILDSPEYQLEHPTPASFVQGVYQDVLGRTADVVGFAGWQGELASGVSRPTVVAGLVGSAEAVDQVIENYYEAYLHRQPELPGSTLWANVLAAPNGSATTVAVGILSSPEFVQDSQ